MKKVAAIIVTYNIEDSIQNSIDILEKQVDEIIIVDNGSKKDTVDMLVNLKCKYNIKHIFLKQNEGIAFALNRGIEYAIEKKYEWILTLDHDSTPTPNMVLNMINTYERMDADFKEKVAMITPVHIEQKAYKSVENSTLEYGYKEVLTEITSGSLVKSDIYKNHGLYDESLFIDLVDHDYCLSLNKKGYKVIQVEDSILIHKLGDSVSKKILGINLTYTNHSPLRRYYMTRNRMYIWKKYSDDYSNWIRRDKIRFISEIAKIIVYENDKIKKIGMIRTGLKDYKLNKKYKFKK